MKSLLKLFACISAFLLTCPAKAQAIEMSEGMRSEGKIYVVIVIAFFVLAVMSIYMISIDRRVRKMENKQK
ncbi:MAG: CcmD family protein [Bacteroidia bacterium]